MRNAEFASSVRASSRRLLLRLVLALLSASLGGLPSAQGQTICTSCWYSVTRLRGTFTMTMSGSGTDGCSSWQASGSSQGSFDTGDPNNPKDLGTLSGTGSYQASGTDDPFCGDCPVSWSESASGSLIAYPPDGGAGVWFNVTDCTYAFWLKDVISSELVWNNSTCNLSLTGRDYGPWVSLALVMPNGFPDSHLVHLPLPPFGEPLVGSATYTVEGGGIPGFSGGSSTVTVSWNIEGVIDEPEPPVFTEKPPGGPLGCNPPNSAIPNQVSILDLVDADAISGMVSIEVDSADVTNGCAVTRSFTFTAKDKCTELESRLVVAYWWTNDTTPAVITSVPAGGYLGYNPTNPPTDTFVEGQVVAVDNCTAKPAITVTHADTVSGGTVTRTFTITAMDGCGNVSPARTVVYTWTTSTTQPALVTSRTGHNLVISWPSWATNFVLQTTTNLMATNSWQAVAIVPTASANWFCVTNSMNDRVRFFRLRSQ